MTSQEAADASNAARSLLHMGPKDKDETLGGWQYGDSWVFWGFITFRDEHSRNQEVKAFIAERMSLVDGWQDRWELNHRLYREDSCIQ